MRLIYFLIITFFTLPNSFGQTSGTLKIDKSIMAKFNTIENINVAISDKAILISTSNDGTEKIYNMVYEAQYAPDYDKLIFITSVNGTEETLIKALYSSGMGQNWYEGTIIFDPYQTILTEQYRNKDDGNISLYINNKLITSKDY